MTGEDAECNGQGYACNAYYALAGDSYVAGNIADLVINNSAGKPCTTDGEGEKGYCSLGGQCIVCGSPGDNLCPSSGTSRVGFLITNAIIGAINCPIKQEMNMNNRRACAGSKTGKPCVFEQYDKDMKDMKVVDTAGECVVETGKGSSAVLICTPKIGQCPDNLQQSACGGSDCCTPGRDQCVNIGWGRAVCLATPNNCPPPNVWCKNDDTKVVEAARGAGVCCNAGWSCGIEKNRGYGFCTKANQCDAEKEIECKGGVWRGGLGVNLDLSGLSLCCDKATQTCYQDGQKVNGVDISGYKNWPLCVTKNTTKECGGEETECRGTGSYSSIFVCCKNGKEYCKHYSEKVPYCKEW